MKQKLLLVLGAIFAFGPFLSGLVNPAPAHAELSTLRNITFPVIGKVNYSDDFAAPRTGHTHEGNDLLGKKLMPLVAAVDGTVTFVVWPEASYGYMVTITDSEGYKYNYLHINNDTPGTDDGLGGGVNAYAPGIESGAKVVKGQLIGWMGDSGNAESTAPHLHFEIRFPDDTAFSPYQSLQQATHITTPVVPAQRGDELLPFSEFSGGASLATGNLDSDSSKEVVVGAGPGGGPLVRRFQAVPSGTINSTATDTSISGDFYAYDPSFRGGVDVATGDVNGDGVDEIITAAGVGGGPHIKVFNQSGTLMNQFMAYAANFHGGVNVAAADLDGDGKAEIVTAPKQGGGPHVRVFKSDGTVVKEFMAYAGNFYGGVDVAAVPAANGKPAMVITGAGFGGGPHVRAFNLQAVEQAGFYAYDPNFHGGIRISAGKVNGVYKLATSPASGGGADFKLFALDGTSATGYTAFEKWWSGGYDVAVGDTLPIVVSGPNTRRVTVRNVKTSSNDGGGFCNHCQF